MREAPLCPPPHGALTLNSSSKASGALFWPLQAPLPSDGAEELWTDTSETMNWNKSVLILCCFSQGFPFLSCCLPLSAPHSVSDRPRWWLSSQEREELLEDGIWKHLAAAHLGNSCCLFLCLEKKAGSQRSSKTRDSQIVHWTWPAWIPLQHLCTYIDPPLPVIKNAVHCAPGTSKPGVEASMPTLLLSQYSTEAA